MQPAILDLDEDYCVATWNTTFIQVWGKQSRPEALQATRRHLAAFGRRTDKHLAIVIVTGESAAFDKTTHETFEMMLADMLDQCAAFAFVYEGSALRATATRSTLLAMTIAKQMTPYRVCKSIDDALAWLTRTAPDPLHGTAYARAQAVRTVRQRFYARKQNLLLRATLSAS